MFFGLLRWVICRPFCSCWHKWLSRVCRRARQMGPNEGVLRWRAGCNWAAKWPLAVGSGRAPNTSTPASNPGRSVGPHLAGKSTWRQVDLKGNYWWRWPKGGGGAVGPRSSGAGGQPVRAELCASAPVHRCGSAAVSFSGTACSGDCVRWQLHAVRAAGSPVQCARPHADAANKLLAADCLRPHSPPLARLGSKLASQFIFKFANLSPNPNPKSPIQGATHWRPGGRPAVVD